MQEYATYLMLDAAEKFKKAFKKMSYPHSLYDAKRNVFMSLVQGDMTVAEYEKRFT